MYIDSHAHLFFKEYDHDLPDVLARAQDAGVQRIIVLGTDLPTSRRSIELAESYEMIHACVGFHPHDASKADAASLAEIEALSHHPKVVAIGEIGLDYHYNFSPPETQREVFSRQIAIARQRDLPIVIHSREAETDTLQIVETTMLDAPAWRVRGGGDAPQLSLPKGVFHCFPGDAAMAEKVISWGFYISFPGPVTFASKPAKPNVMAGVARTVSLDHVLLETDSPYLTPVPFRGKRNEPAYIPHIAREIASLRGCTVEEVAQRTSLAVERLFGVSLPSPAKL